LTEKNRNLSSLTWCDPDLAGYVDQHTADRLRQWLCRKHKVQGAGTKRYPYRYLYEQLNLVRLEGRRHNFTWANA
jgi:hypothetical protein